MHVSSAAQGIMCGVNTLYVCVCEGERGLEVDAYVCT